MQDRNSRPHRLRQPTAAATIERVAEQRRPALERRSDRSRKRCLSSHGQSGIEEAPLEQTQRSCRYGATSAAPDGICARQYRRCLARRLRPYRARWAQGERQYLPEAITDYASV